MASEQELVRDAWLAARKGNLCALSECKAWALREVWREQKGPKARRILRVKICIASKRISSSVNMTIFKSDLDLHLSDSDWCGLVVRFWLSYLNENRFPDKRGLGTKIGLKF